MGDDRPELPGRGATMSQPSAIDASDPAPGNSEAASEKPRRRGRAPRFSPGIMDTARWVAGDSKTGRHLVNVAYMQRALALLEGTPDLQWLFDPAAMMADKHEPCKPAFRPGILAELGRIDDPEDMRALALQLCELKPKTHDAVAMLRQWRTGKVPKAQVSVKLDCRALEQLDRFIEEVGPRSNGKPWSRSQAIFVLLALAKEEDDE